MKAAKARIATIALGGVLALSACSGTTSAQTAATVDGRVITVQDVTDATDQINEAFELQQPVTQAQALSLLIIGPVLTEAAAKSGRPVSESAVRASPEMQKLSEPPTQATIEAVRANASQQSIDQTAGPALLKQIGELKVSVNPRFGTFDPEQAAIVVKQPNWIVPSAAATSAP